MSTSLGAVVAAVFKKGAKSVKYKTLKNIEKAVLLIMEKGYDREEANSMAITCFDASKTNGMSVEWWIKRILSKEEWLRESQSHELSKSL